MDDHGFPGEVRPGVLTNYQDTVAELLWNDFEPDEEADGLYRVCRHDTTIGTFIVRRMYCELNGGYWDISAERVPKGEESMFWEQAVQEVTLERDEPEEGDYVIEVMMAGYRVAQLNGAWKGDNWDEMLEAIKADMNAKMFWPDVWLLSDHGNFTLLDLSKEGS